MDSFERFAERNLPPQVAFHSRLRNESINDKEYEHAQNVWKVFGCKTMRDYHDMYLMSDVLMLADVFENFRQMSLEVYKLDPVHYYSLPGLAWDAALKYTCIELELN